jgi:hypothetical protein
MTLGVQMSEQTIHEIYSTDRLRRVLIVQRSNGFFGFEEEYLCDETSGQYWCRYSQVPFGIFDSAETALREAHGRVTWLNSIDGHSS